MFSSISLKGRIVTLGIILPAVLLMIVFSLYYFQSKRKTIDAYVGKARAVCLTAESTRDEMEAKWELGLLNVEMLQKYMNEGDNEKLLSAVPVVSAWRAAMRKADQGGYTFKVPKFEPRNPANKPDELESRILKKISDENLTEYYIIDRETNSVRYFLPVRLSETCLLCHGDPGTSQKLWGNSKGMDAVGGKMENWKAGEIHGAFEVIQSLDEADSQVASSMLIGGGIVFVGLLLMGAIFYMVILLTVDRPVTAVAEQLMGGASEVSSASDQVSSSSQELADGAATQAAMLEESSSSLEEMTSMTRSNAENTTVADNMANEAREATARGVESMKKLSSAIDAINKSSDETARIIKSIDEIAFQTNLLALNAAVEAARAGEAGKGFAVVAEEVRSLAGRSAEAAKSTTDLIIEAQANSKNGVKVNEEVAQELQEITGLIDKVTQIINEVSKASDEQAQGIDQINTAVSHMDRVTQQIAATSETSASAAEELNSQSIELKDMVNSLLNIVKGS